jgi:HEPN domain-containing protein
MKPEQESYIRSWIAKADQDFMSAERLITIAPPILEPACFHCQQAIEKYLKAYLIFNGVDIERTHDIERLLAQSASFDSFFASIDPGDINLYAVDVRYPSYYAPPTLTETNLYYSKAQEIREAVIQKMGL